METQPLQSGRPASLARTAERFARHAARAFALPFVSCLSLMGALLCADAGRAGELAVYEASVGSGQVRVLAGPVVNLPLDLDYAPVSAEGGKLYGMSEIEIEATGDLVLTPTGFSCQATSCLYSPLPFTAGKQIRITAGNDLAGEMAANANLLTIGLSGTSGLVVLTRGEYVDANGPAASVGDVQTVDVTILAAVPEPATGAGLAAAWLLLAGLASRRAATETISSQPLRKASASARSGSAPASRAPRAR